MIKISSSLGETELAKTLNEIDKVIIKKGEKINYLKAKKLHSDGLKEVLVSSEFLYGKYCEFTF